MSFNAAKIPRKKVLGNRRKTLCGAKSADGDLKFDRVGSLERNLV